jgi:hypothetical protein
MRHVKLGLFALLGLVGAASAFTNAPKHFNGTTYYSITDNAGGFTWTTTRPPSTACDAETTPPCTIVTKNGYQPKANEIPTLSQATILSHGIHRPL